MLLKIQLWPKPRSEKMSEGQIWHFELCFDNLLHELIFGLLRMQNNSKHPTVFMLSIRVRHDATALPRQWFHRLLSICIKIKMTANAKPAVFLHMRDHPGAMTNPELCSLTLWGQLCWLREDVERLRFTTLWCWHVDRWRGCLSATVCYRHLIAIDPFCCTINCKSSINHKLLTCCTPKLKLHSSVKIGFQYMSAVGDSTRARYTLSQSVYCCMLSLYV